MGPFGCFIFNRWYSKNDRVLKTYYVFPCILSVKLKEKQSAAAAMYSFTVGTCTASMKIRNSPSKSDVPCTYGCCIALIFGVSSSLSTCEQ